MQPQSQLLKVSKQFLHLHDEKAVLPTGGSILDPDHFSVDVRWPAAEGTDRSAHYDAVLLAQTVRQCGLLVAHGGCGVPVTHQTLLSNLGYTVNPDYRVPREKPSELTVEAVCSRARRRGNTLSALRQDFTIRHDGEVVARADLEFTWISQAVYDRVRQAAHAAFDWEAVRREIPPAVPPEEVDCATEDTVVLAPSDDPDHMWRLRNNVDNRFFFDHPVDHVPGLVLLEAARQAAYAVTGPSGPGPTDLACVFERYVEFDGPCWIEAAVVPGEEPGSHEVRVTATQNDHSVFRATVSGPRREPRVPTARSGENAP